MQEKFYCVGCKSHYELDPTGLERKPSKGGSFRYAIKSVCPEGHRTSKICNSDNFRDHANGLELCPECGSETWYWEDIGEPYLIAECDDCGHDGMYNEYEAEGMTVGVNLEALAPTPDEPESGESLVPADSLLPEGSGRTIGSQSVSHNYTPFHSEDFIPWSEEADSEDCYICGKDNSAYYVEEEDNICSSCDSNWEYDSDMDGYVKKKAEQSEEMIECGNCDATFSIDEGLDIGGIDYCEECYDTRMSKDEYLCKYCGQDPDAAFADDFWTDGVCIPCAKEHGEYEDYDAEGQKFPCDSCNQMVSRSDLKVMSGSYDEDYQICRECLTYDAEEFIAHRKLKDHLLSVMPDKVYGVKDLGDGEFEMRVADRYMDDVIEAVSEYQISESDSFFLGQSKSTVAAVAAVVALGFAFWQNRKR